MPEVGVFAFGLVLGQALSAATTPIFTRILGPSEFGVFDVLTVLTVLVGTLLLAGLDQALVRSYFDDDADAAHTAVASTGFTLVVITGVVGCALLAPWAAPLGRLMLGRGGHTGAVLAALVGIPFSVAVAYVIEVVRVERRAGPFTILGVVRAVAGAAAGILLVVVADQKAEGVILGLAVGSAAALAYGVAVVRHRLRLNVHRVELRRMLSFGLPLIPTGIAFWSLMVVDRLVLVHYVSLRQVGYYALGNKIALLLLWAVYGFRAGWTPVMLRDHVRDAAKAIQERADWLQQSVALTALAAALLGALAVELTLLGGGRDFRLAARIVPLMLVAIVLFSSTIVVQSPMIVTRRTRVIAGHTVGSAIVNLVACFVLVPVWGIYGAAVATVLGFAYLSVGFYLSAQQITRAPYRLGALATTVALVGPYLLLGQVQVGPLWTSVPVKLAAIALLPWVMGRLGLLPLGRGREAVDRLRRLSGRSA